jgi:hypothetical protein
MANYKKWSNVELDFIQSNHGILCDEALASKLSQMTGQNISTAMVRRQRRKLSLKKSRGRPKKIISTNTVPVSNDVVEA